MATDFFIELDATNSYLLANVGGEGSVILDETTMTGDTAEVYFDSGISTTFIQVDADVTFAAYGTTGYADIYWDIAVPLDSVELWVTFYSQISAAPFTEITTFTARNTNGTLSLSLLFPSAVSVPAGGGIDMTVIFEDMTATETFAGEISLTWGQDREWWVGVAGWG